MDKETVVYIYDGVLFSHKKEWNLTMYDNMNGPSRYYSKWNKSDKHKYCIISLTCGA